MAEPRSTEEFNLALDESMTRPLTDEIIRLMETKCIRMNGARTDWRALFSRELDQLLRSRSSADFEKRVNDILSHGGLSHVAFFHESAQRAPARYAINATFFACHTSKGTRWAFQDVLEGGPAYVGGVRPGYILLAVDDVPVAPPTLPKFALGRDSVVTIQDANDSVGQLRLILPKATANGNGKARPPMAEPTSVTARTIEPGIGYVRVAFFPGANGQRFARELDQALATLGDPAGLIIDLRGNLGGFVGSLRLMSYLTPDRIPVGYSLTRLGEDRGLKPEQLPCIDQLPKTKAAMLRMAFKFLVLNRDRSVRLVTEGLGPKKFHGRIVMLTNEHTLSAGEMVAAFASENRLATLVGAQTGGQVLGGANFPAGHGFVLRLPAAGWYTWSGSTVEGYGVQPAVRVPLSPTDLLQGEDGQLHAAVDLLSGLP